MPGQSTDAVLTRNNVRVIGEGDRTIIFAHGFGSDQTSWSSQIQAFQNTCRCVLFDHVGSGKSDESAFSPKRYSNLYSYASDVIEICDALGVTGATVVAHSVSGMVSLIASILRPDLFHKAAIIGASPRYLNDSATGYHGGFEREDLEGIFGAMAANYHAWASGFAPVAMGNPERPHLADYYAETLTAVRPDIAQAVLRVIFLSDHRAELSKVKTLVYVLQSRSDVAVPSAVGDYLAGHISRSRLVSLESQGHLPHVSAPHAVNQAIEALLAA